MNQESPYFERETLNNKVRYQLIPNTIISHLLSDYLIEDIKTKVCYNPCPMMLMCLLNGLKVSPFLKSVPEKRLKVDSEFVGEKLKFQIIDTPKLIANSITSEMCVKNMKTGEVFNPSPANIVSLMNGGKISPCL